MVSKVIDEEKRDDSSTEFEQHEQLDEMLQTAGLLKAEESEKEETEDATSHGEETSGEEESTEDDDEETGDEEEDEVIEPPSKVPSTDTKDQSQGNRDQTGQSADQKRHPCALQREVKHVAPENVGSEGMASRPTQRIAAIELDRSEGRRVARLLGPEKRAIQEC